MQTPPRRTTAGLFQTLDYAGILLAGVTMGGLALMLYVRPWLDGAVDPQWSRAMAFAVLGFGPCSMRGTAAPATARCSHSGLLLPLALVGACLLSASLHLLSSAVPALRPVFHTFPLSAADWLIVVVLSASIPPLIELAKVIDGRSFGEGVPWRPEMPNKQDILLVVCSQVAWLQWLPHHQRVGRRKNTAA